MTEGHMMKTLVRAALASLLLAATSLQAQQTTERFIPIGESPGVSGKYSYIGEIVAIDEASRTITVRDEDGDHQLRMTDETEIWVDRSDARKQNLTGSYEDCEIGRKVEVMHEIDDADTAAWIKIESG